MQFLKLSLKIAGWVSVIVGIIVLTISFFIYFHTRSFVQSASRAEGTVIGLDENRGGSGSYPVFMFRDAKGQAHQIESNTGEHPPAYKIGDVVTVLYQSNRPANAEIDSFFNVWGWNILLGGIGIFNFVFGLGILAVAIKIESGNPRPTIHPAVPANKPENMTLEISYPKALLVSMVSMACFGIVIFASGIPVKDPLLIGFIIVMITGMSFVFAGCLCFMLRCKIGEDGLRSAVPTFYQQVLRWEDIVRVQGFGSPFYVVRGRFLKGQCLLPRKFLLKRPNSLKESIERYAPADNIVHKKFAGKTG